MNDALTILRHRGISQLPVLAGGQNLGSVHEDEILRASLADETVLERSVASVLEAPFPEVTADTPVSDVLHRLKEEKVLLVRDAATDTLIGLLTRHDLVGFLSEQGGSHAV